MAKKLWGGRFTKKTNPLVEEFTKSIQFDKKLAEYDCIGSLYHINVLKKAGILSPSEHKKLQKGLNEILKSLKSGKLKIDESFEDIHSLIQDLLEKKAGKAALKLHTARSRNDQVVFDVKLYSLDNILKTKIEIENLQNSFLKLAGKNIDIYMPGYTHLQHAIPVFLGNYLTAYYDMLDRDAKRLENALNNIELTMGSGALAATFIEAEKYSDVINKIPVSATANSIDAVSDRDFVIEILSALGIIGMHLSRLSEDLILWSTKEFDFIDIDESFCTGSSLMPQKKNPDVLELIRGNSGKLYGNLMNVLTMMKGLPLSYNRDMQLDKEPLFNSFEIIQSELKVLAELLLNIEFKRENIEYQLQDETLYATDMADYLVQNGVSFKEAHSIIGNLIMHKLKNGLELLEMEDSELKKFHPKLNLKIVKLIINPKTSVKSKKSVRKRK